MCTEEVRGPKLPAGEGGALGQPGSRAVIKRLLVEISFRHDRKAEASRPHPRPASCPPGSRASPASPAEAWGCRPPPADPACPAAQTPPAHLVLPRAGWGQSDGSHRAWVSTAPPGGRRAACPRKQRHTPPGSTHCVGEAFTTELVLQNEREHSGRMLGAHRSRGRAVGQLPDCRTRGAMRGRTPPPGRGCSPGVLHPKPQRLQGCATQGVFPGGLDSDRDAPLSSFC